jgi:hypothetical protein
MAYSFGSVDWRHTGYIQSFIFGSNQARFPADPRKLGQWLGRDHANDPAMCYKILKPNGHWTFRSSCTPLSDSYKSDAVFKDRMTAFTTKIDDIIGKFNPSFILEEETDEFETLPSLDETEDESNIPPLDVDDEDTLDPLINAEIISPQGDGIAYASVMEKMRAHDGSSIRSRNKNPLLDSRIYVVKFPDGEMKYVGYNILAEHISPKWTRMATNSDYSAALFTIVAMAMLFTKKTSCGSLGK